MAAVGRHPHAFDIAITHEERVAVGGVGRPVATTRRRRDGRDATASGMLAGAVVMIRRP
jgi:hypothetical protein